MLVGAQHYWTFMRHYWVKLQLCHVVSEAHQHNSKSTKGNLDQVIYCGSWGSVDHISPFK